MSWRKVRNCKSRLIRSGAVDRCAGWRARVAAVYNDLGRGDVSRVFRIEGLLVAPGDDHFGAFGYEQLGCGQAGG